MTRAGGRIASAAIAASARPAWRRHGLRRMVVKLWLQRTLGRWGKWTSQSTGPLQWLWLQMGGASA